jgi:hypothetical protein
MTRKRHRRSILVVKVLSTSLAPQDLLRVPEWDISLMVMDMNSYKGKKNGDKPVQRHHGASTPWTVPYFNIYIFKQKSTKMYHIQPNIKNGN